MTWCIICNKEWKNQQLAVSCCIVPTLKSIAENETYSHMKQAISSKLLYCTNFKKHSRK